MEYWDIYDEDRKLTGRKMVRNDWNMKPGDYHLTVLGVLKRKSDGRYLITRRVMTKSWAPGHWEIPGGGVKAGEASYDAVVREISEETGIDVSGWQGDVVFTYKRENPEEGDNYFVDVYCFEGEFSPDQIKLLEDETMDFEIADIQRIKELGESGVFLHFDSIRSVFGL